MCILLILHMSSLFALGSDRDSVAYRSQSEFQLMLVHWLHGTGSTAKKQQIARNSAKNFALFLAICCLRHVMDVAL
jgi:hypothetical protein